MDAYQIDIDYKDNSRVFPPFTAFISKDGDPQPMALLASKTLEEILAKIEMTMTYETRGNK